tara:strand:+ start:239 stop:421 length:183 start_codon:yes stop_codon:yes gene_type:complete
MTTRPIKVLTKALNDLWVRDVEKFILDKNYSMAKVLMQNMGMSRKNINEIIKEVQDEGGI